MVKVIFPSQGLVKVFEKQELTKLTLANGHHICQFTIYIYGKILWTHIEMIILNHLVFWHIFGVFFCFYVDLFLTTGQKYATIPWKDSFRRCHALDDLYIFWYLPTTALEFSKYILTDENRPVCTLVFIWKLY